MKYLLVACLLTLITACSVTTVARPAPRPTPSVPVMTPEPTLLLQYNVDESGKPVDIKVVDASPKGLFEEASIEALQGWEYQPPMKDGRRQPMTGLYNLFTFKMM